MHAPNRIQNATTNANAAIPAAHGVDGAYAHRSCVRGKSSCEVRPVSMCPSLGAIGSTFSYCGSADLKQGQMPADAVQREIGTHPESTSRHGRKWRLDDRHLPETAWAILVLNRALCG